MIMLEMLFTYFSFAFIGCGYQADRTSLCVHGPVLPSCSGEGGLLRGGSRCFLLSAASPAASCCVFFFNFSAPM